MTTETNTPVWVTGDTVDRDRWKRPLVIPQGGAKPVPYTRVSTLAKSLDDGQNLTAWKQRVTVVGLAKRPDLRTRLGGIIAKHADPVSGDGKRDLTTLCGEAAEAGGSTAAAGTGTGLHTLTEAVDAGAPLSDLLVDELTRSRLAEYRAATAALEVLGTEDFTVTDEVTAAGTFDRLVRLPDGRVVVADLKTGAWDAKYPLPVSLQIAVYAHGHRYASDGQRGILHPDLDPTVGLLIHLPAKGQGCAVYPLDLVKGWEAALVAADVMAVRKWKPADLIGNPLDLTTPTTEA